MEYCKLNIEHFVGCMAYYAYSQTQGRTSQFTMNKIEQYYIYVSRQLELLYGKKIMLYGDISRLEALVYFNSDCFEYKKDNNMVTIVVKDGNRLAELKEIYKKHLDPQLTMVMQTKQAISKLTGLVEPQGNVKAI